MLRMLHGTTSLPKLGKSAKIFVTVLMIINSITVPTQLITHPGRLIKTLEDIKELETQLRAKNFAMQYAKPHYDNDATKVSSEQSGISELFLTVIQQ